MRVGRWSAVALSVAVVVSTAAPAAAAEPAWRLASIPRLAATSSLQDVVAVDARNAWAVGLEGYDPGQETGRVPLILRWNGFRWSRMSPPAVPERMSLTHVGASSPKDVWVTGASGSDEGNVFLVWHYDGRTWTEVPYPPGATPSRLEIRDVSVVDGRPWLVGIRGNAPVFHEWTGTSWLEHQPPTECVAGGGFPNFCFANTVKAFAPDDVWAAGNGWWNGFMGPVLFHWNGTAWRTVDIGQIQQPLTIRSLDGLSSKDIWAVGDSGGMGSGNVVVRGDGTTWQSVAGLQTPSTPAVAVGADGVPQVVARVPLPTFRSYGPAGWTMAMAPFPADSASKDYSAITAVPGTNRMIALGSTGLPGTSPMRFQALIAEYSTR
ncbi:WD40/YVTN/BNR-like repeat-containing protein [Lentzea sp. NPDC058436]|uniref:WD40/YVTN/BNR-like repeat-containing protein n=1 Tax=Lentzea sp. NPDC058436 TaxID=3346499 RepID=UPI0036694A6C